MATHFSDGPRGGSGPRCTDELRTRPGGADPADVFREWGLT
jgi:hypothetical protein